MSEIATAHNMTDAVTESEISDQLVGQDLARIPEVTTACKPETHVVSDDCLPSSDPDVVSAHVSETIDDSISGPSPIVILEEIRTESLQQTDCSGQNDAKSCIATNSSSENLFGVAEKKSPGSASILANDDVESAAVSEGIAVQEPQPVDPVPTVQKLTIKIPRSMSIPAAPTSAKIDSDGLALLATAAALCNSVELDQQSTAHEGNRDGDAATRLTIAHDSPHVAVVPLKSTPRLNSLKKKRPVIETEDDEEEQMLREGTEINGFIYFSSKKVPPPLPELTETAPIVPRLTSSGRPARQAALNNPLIRGGFVSDAGNDNGDTTYSRPKPKPGPPKSMKAPVLDDPEAKLAKVKASLKTFTPHLSMEKSVPSLPKPVKITATAKQRLGRKLGLK